VLWNEVNRAIVEGADALFGPDDHGNVISIRPGEVAGFVVEPKT
jgi:hypothetical protein